MTPLEALKARIAAATKGPWTTHRGDRIVVLPPSPEEYEASFAVNAPSARELIPHGILYHADAEFIAHAREDAERLIELIEACLQDNVDSGVTRTRTNKVLMYWLTEVTHGPVR